MTVSTFTPTQYFVNDFSIGYYKNCYYTSDERSLLHTINKLVHYIHTVIYRYFKVSNT